VNESAESSTFLGVPNAETARVHILPAPYEQTVSYEGGTSMGPEAIMAASAQVELYDRAFGCEPYAHYGLNTLNPFETQASSAMMFSHDLSDHVSRLVKTDRLLVGLGGEHTVTVGLMRGTARALEVPLTLVQIDAHCDLRDTYEDNPYSHACIARRLLEDGAGRVVQVGIRSLCAEEADFINANRDRVSVFYADDIHADPAGGWLQSLSDQLTGQAVYLSIDLDGLDPGVIPATGTPEPGGLTWHQAVSVIATVCRSAQVVGLDVMELAPRQGLHAADFAAAKLTYHMINHVAQSRGWLV
jgi:agmatinase